MKCFSTGVLLIRRRADFSTSYRDIHGLVVKRLDFALVNTDSTPIGPTHGEMRLRLTDPENMLKSGPDDP